MAKASEGMIAPYYEANGITIYHGRAEDVLPTLSGAALVLGDPCYGTTELDWDIPADWSMLWPMIYRACLPTALQVLFSAQPFTTDLIVSNRARFRYEIIWDKTMPTGFLDANRRPLRAHENILVFADKFGSSTYHPQMIATEPRKRHHAIKGAQPAHYGKINKLHNVNIVTNKHPVDVQCFSNGHGGSSDHETAKPLDLMLWLIQSYSNVGDLVIDPFMGNGPVLEACKILGRRAVGIDIRESCCDAAARRLQQEVMEFI